jgi:hypothetical protein
MKIGTLRLAIYLLKGIEKDMDEKRIQEDGMRAKREARIMGYDDTKWYTIM